MIDLSLVPNPFSDNVVRDAWQEPLDVPSIHDDVFQACLRGIDSASRGVPDSLLIYGSAGAGKTHLLTRLQRHLALTAQKAPDSVLRCVFVFVRLQTSPLMLWQHVRRRLCTDLMRRDQGLTQLQRLVAHQLAALRGESPRAAVLRMRVLSHADSEELRAQFRQASAELALPHELNLVLEHLITNQKVSPASRWLSGEYLSEEELSSLGIGPDLCLDREQAARELVLMLCRLAGESLPLVFCFDQVEALQRSPNDAEAFFRFGQVGADLHDSDRNVFLITCLQSACLEFFQSSVRQADRDRMAKRHAVLSPLTREQMVALVAARLELVPELGGARTANPSRPLYPLPDQLLENLAASPRDCVARRVLAECARSFEELRTGVVRPRLAPEAYLNERAEKRRLERQNQLGPSDCTRILLRSAQVLRAVADLEVTDRDEEGADLVLLGEKPAAVSLRNEADGRSLLPRVRDLLAHTPRKDGKRVVMVRDPRLTIPKTAARTRELLSELEARGAVLVHPTAEALAALDALNLLLAEAKAGDLAVEGESLSEESVVAWLRGLGRDSVAASVHELIVTLTEEERGTPPVGQSEDLARLLSTEHVLPLCDAARTLERSEASLLSLVRAEPHRYLLLEGAEPCLVDLSGLSPEWEA